MLLIRDSDSFWSAEICRYNKDYDSIQIKLDGIPIKLDLVLSKDQIRLDVRDESHQKIHETSFSIRELMDKSQRELMERRKVENSSPSYD